MVSQIGMGAGAGAAGRLSLEGRSHMSRRVLPVDLIIAAYNVALACLWLSTIHRATLAGVFAIAHLVAAGVPWYIGLLPEKMPRPAAVARETYPFVALAIFWAELGLMQRVRQLPSHDVQISAWDQAIFGLHLHQVWSTAMPAHWFSEVMYGSYFSYYLLLVSPPLAFALAGRVDALRDLSLRAMVTYLGCFLCYLAFPVLGPHSFDSGHAVSGAPGLLHTLVDRARESGDSPGTAFPSSHVAGALTMAWAGWRWYPRPIAIAMVVLACLVPLSTIYTGNHYAIDALAGVLWTVIAQALFVPLCQRAAR